MKRITLDVTANLRESPPEGTPVDTGFARNNWIPNIATPVTEVAGAPARNDATAVNQGVARVATQYRLDDGPTFVSNNVGYISRLNDGSSQQTPAGFIQRAIEKAVRRTASE